MSNRERHIEWLKDKLGRGRMAHSLAVEARAGVLARIHGEDEEKAALAGLLHDCCKDMPKAGQLKIIETRGILLDKHTRAQPKLWHAIAASVLIEDRLGVSDPEILDAVRQHTTGAADMSRLSQVLYLADLTSEDRDYPDIAHYRALAEKDMAAAMLECLAFIIRMLIAEGEPVARDSIDAYNHFLLIEREHI
jgi:predicted HD superfamily hydrolase involved in NAD metabolism